MKALDLFKVFIILSLLVVQSCDWFSEKTTNQEIKEDPGGGCSLPPDEPHYVMIYYNINESLFFPGTTFDTALMDEEGNNIHSWGMDEPGLETDIEYDNFDLQLFREENYMYISDSYGEDYFDDLIYSFSNDEGTYNYDKFNELTEYYNDTDYNSNPPFSYPCAVDPIIGIHVYAEPTYREGYEDLPINDLVDIKAPSAREFIENGYSYDGIEDLFTNYNGMLEKSLNEFNSVENYLIGIDGIKLRLTQPPSVSGDYTFTIVYQDRDENGVNEYNIVIGPIPIIGEN